MNIEFLRYYVTVVETRNISKAASILYISRQALSKSIRHAEVQLETKLIDTQAQKLTVTESGKIFYQNAKTILEVWDATISELKERNTVTTTLQAGFGRMSNLVWPEAHTKEFCRLHPSIQLVTQSLVIDRLIALLRKEELDVVISNVYISDPDYEVETLLQRPIYAVVHQEDPLSGKAIITPEDLTGRTNIFLAEDKLGAEYFQNMMDRKQLSAQIFFCPDSSLPTVFHTIAAYQGVFLTSAIFKDFLSPTKCVYVPFETGLSEEDYNMNIHFIYAKQNPKKQALQSYRDYLRTHIKDSFTNPAIDNVSPEQPSM
ncbi:MAG: LysR family transcriptional regulator [Clostridiales bacterium]|nr:LysR family transcriptional regulator [Clostridiales bacterium]